MRNAASLHCTTILQRAPPTTTVATPINFILQYDDVMIQRISAHMQRMRMLAHESNGHSRKTYIRRNIESKC